MTVVPQCFRCRHFRPGYVCAAFPDGNGIPNPILQNEHDHRRPYPGDNGVRFEPKPGPFPEVRP
jgi:hypothetical protein